MSKIFFSSLLCIVLVMQVCGQIQYQTYNLDVDFSASTKPFPNYWNGSGFTPADILFRKDMHLNLDYQAAIPNDGLKFMRPHWLLNMVSVEGHETDNPVYNFDVLFEALDEFVNRDIQLVFEIMGFPTVADENAQMQYDEFAQGMSGNVQQWIPDFEKSEDYLKWHEFVKILITNLENRYGTEVLKSWYFESTNEPDVHQWFWDQGIPALLNYWDATSEAIKAINPEYKFGGPGNATVLSEEFKAVMAHCDTGTNAITGQSGAVLDFISVHSKNLPYNMIDMEIQSIEYIRENHPRFADIPFWNNEADPTWGWRRDFWWRPKSWYAAFLIQSIDAHNRLTIDSIDAPFELLVNDKGFLGNWYHRTETAGFQKNSNNEEFWLVKKPVLNAMTLLALSAGERFDVQGFPSTRESTSVIASRTNGGQHVLLVANMPEFGPVRSGGDNDNPITPQQKELHNQQGSIVNIAMDGMDIENTVFTHIRIDDIHGNPYGVWKSLGSPENPTKEEYDIMAANMEPVMIEKHKKMNNETLSLSMPPSSVSMIIFSDKEDEGIPQEKLFPDIRKVNHYTGLDGEKKEFVTWDQITERLVFYNVYVSYDGGEFELLNPSPLLDLGYLHVLPEGKTNAAYRVEAIAL